MRALAAIFCLVLTLTAPAAVERAEIDFDHVRKLAVRRAAQAYRAPSDALPPRLATLTYDEYRNIGFRPERALWRGDGLPFQVQLFARGGLYRRAVTVREFSPTHVQTVPFDATWFHFVEPVHELTELPRDLGYAGFRVLHPLNRADAFDEVISFLGASYFRALGAGQQYGLSARGLALDAAIRGRREEFPDFTEFWLGKPVPDAPAVTVYALMDGPSVAGAFEFVITPGKATFVDVRAELMFRSAGRLTGIAPLTSMFWYGENTARPDGEMRPEVHDSDGLLVREKNGAQIWRPLRNPAAIVNVDIPVRELSRFGLAQRDRRIESYEDREAYYERRPTAWIEPRDGWGSGKVRLVELPAMMEYGDNIAAYWIPDNAPQPGAPLELRYRIVWASAEPADEPVARVVATREGARPGQARGRLFWIDFTDPKAAERNAAAPIAAIEVGPGGRLVHSKVARYPEIGGWRVALEVESTGASADAVELRCQLRDNDSAISETWLYPWTF
jgi:periplasmic glucans biosynthesis protein